MALGHVDAARVRLGELARVHEDQLEEPLQVALARDGPARCEQRVALVDGPIGAVMSDVGVAMSAKHFEGRVDGKLRFLDRCIATQKTEHASIAKRPRRGSRWSAEENDAGRVVLHALAKRVEQSADVDLTSRVHKKHGDGPTIEAEHMVARARHGHA